MRLTARRRVAYVIDVYVLTLAYLVVAQRNGGRRSVPDLVAGTAVDRFERR